MNEKNVIGSIFSKRMSEIFDLRVENDKVRKTFDMEFKNKLN